MAQTGKTPIQFYRSSTPSAVPDAANLNAGEVAINTADVALYAENSSGVVKRIINNPAGLKYPTADGTANQVLVTNGSGNLSFATPTSGTTYQAIASGSLSNGTKVVINSNGTVSAVTQVLAPLNPPTAGSETVFTTNGTTEVAASYDAAAQRVVISYRDETNSNRGTSVVGTVSGSSITFGSPVVFDNIGAQAISSAYDSVNQKIIIAYRGLSSGDVGFAIVGTVSGTSISFGTRANFNNSATDTTSVAYDSTSQRVVIAYRNNDNLNRGTAVVGTVSGTSISFGTPVVFNSTGSTRFISAVYDSANNKTVIAYNDQENFSQGACIVGTVSGTSISFGSEVIFTFSEADNISATYDSTNQKVVIVYRDRNNADYGTAIVGTVSGTSISFGTPTVFSSNSSAENKITYDSTINRVVVAYRNDSNSLYGTVIVGTVSGTGISFGTAAVFNSATTTQIAVTYNSNAQRAVVAYRDNGNLNYGTSCVITTQSLSTNLTSENYIGISDAAYTNGQTATIQTVGSVDDAQTGLVAGQAYYVQQNGTLSQTPDTPSVFAGTAVSSTKLIVKG